MKSLGICLLVLGCSMSCGLALETELERMERRILATPAAEIIQLYHVQLKLGGKDAVEERWKGFLEEASSAEKARWALLLAMNASPPYREPDIDRSKRWLEQAGDGVEAHSFRAVIASLENDTEATLQHLDAAFQRQPSLRLLRQKLQALIARDGAAFDDEAELAYWLARWTSQAGQTALRLEIANHLTRLYSTRNRRQEWIDSLEKAFAEGPESHWVEACALAATSLEELHADTSHAWIGKARAAGAPPTLLLKAEGDLLSICSGSAMAYYSSDFYRFPPEDSYGAINFASSLPMLAGKLADYMERNAPLIMENPLALLQLVQKFQAPAYFEDRELEEAVLHLLKTRCKNKPDDLEARFVYGRLLGLTEESKDDGARELEDFLQGALNHLGRTVLSLNELSSHALPSTFDLRFPPQKIDEEKPAAPEPVTSTFAFPDHRAEEEPEEGTDYPNSEYFDQEGNVSTVGDLFLAGLFHLRELNPERFQVIYRQWLREANPPLPVRLNFAVKADGSRSSLGLTTEIVASILASDEASEDDLIEVLRALEKGRAKPEQIRRAGDRLATLNLANRPGADMIYLSALLEWKQADEAKAMFPKVRAHARPGNEKDEGLLWSSARRLASVCKDKTLELPRPAFFDRFNTPEDPDAEFKRLGAYFKTTRPPLTNPEKALRTDRSLGSILFVSPGSLQPGQSRDVMFRWGMVSIDPALSIYESGFAFKGVPDDLLTPELMSRLVKEVGEDNPALAAVRAFYDGKLEPDEQLRRIEAVAARFPDDQRFKLTVAAKAMTSGHYRKAVDIAASSRIDYGEEKWIRHALILVSARALGDNETAKAAARALVPITWATKSREWLADHFEHLGLPDEAAAMRATPEFLISQ